LSERTTKKIVTLKLVHRRTIGDGAFLA